MDNTVSGSVTVTQAEYIPGSKYIKSRNKSTAASKAQKPKKEKAVQGTKYLRMADSSVSGNAESKYVKNSENEKKRPGISKYVVDRSGTVSSASVGGRFLVENAKRRNWLKLFTVASIYLYIGSLYVIAYTDYSIISRMLFLVMLFFTAANTVLDRNKISIDLPNVFIVLFLAYALLSSFWVVKQDLVDQTMSTLAQLVVLYMCIRLNITSMKDLRMVLNAIIVGTLLMCVYTVFYYGVPYIISQIAVGGRIGKEINQVNGMGMYCSILLCIMTYMIFYEKKYLYIIALPMVLLIQLGCGSRKGFALAFLGVFVVLFFRTGNKKILFLLGALMALAVAIYFVYEFAESNYFFYRITQMLALVDSNEVTENSIGVRSQMIEFGMELFKQNPIRGYGLLQFEYLYGLKYGAGRPPHSTYIQMLVSFGMIGFTLYYAIYVYFIKNIIVFLKRRTRYVVLMAAMVVLLLFNDFGANMLNNKYAYIFLAILASFVSQAKALDEKGLTDDPEEV